MKKVKKSVIFRVFRDQKTVKRILQTLDNTRFLNLHWPKNGQNFTPFRDLFILGERKINLL